MKRRSTWGQDTPSIQLRVILGSLDMNLESLSEGIGDSEKVLARCRSHMQDCKDLAESIDSGDNKWDEV